MPSFLAASIMPTAPERKARVWPLALSFLVFLLLTVFLNLGRWLVVDDPLSHASAIAVLSGRMPDRVLEASRIYRGGYAPEVWLTHSTEPGSTLEKLDVPYTGDDTYNKLILIHEGVPESAIRIIDPPILDTADEILAIGQNLQRQQYLKVILVTSRVHTRRTKSLWNLLASKQGQAIVRGVSGDSFDPSHWWRTTGDALDVVRETLGLLNVWAGLPLRPAT